MRHPSRCLWIAAVAVAAGCASTPPTVAVAPRVAPIAVSCTEGALSDTPCVAMARQRCAAPQVDTIRLVLARTADPADKARYDYEATYACPTGAGGTARLAPQ